MLQLLGHPVSIGISFLTSVTLAAGEATSSGADWTDPPIVLALLSSLIGMGGLLYTIFRGEREYRDERSRKGRRR